MALAETRYEHILVDEQGVPYIAGTTMKVAELVMAQAAYGWSPEELHFQFPHLALGQIHSALAYYWDHEQELNADIARREADVAQYEQTLPSTSDLRRRLLGQV